MSIQCLKSWAAIALVPDSRRVRNDLTPDLKLERSESGSKFHSCRARPLRLPANWISSSSSVQPFQVDAHWRDGIQSSIRTSGSSPEKVSNGGALPLRAEPGTHVAGTGGIRPDDAGVIGVVTELGS